MSKASFLLTCLGLAACGVAFTPTAKDPGVPSRFEDVNDSLAHEDERNESLALKTSVTGGKPAPPPVGISFVVGGTALDAGPLPKPPIPIVEP